MGSQRIGHDWVTSLFFLSKNRWPNLFTISDQSVHSNFASFFSSPPFLFALNSTLEKSSVSFWCRIGSHAPIPPPAPARFLGELVAEQGEPDPICAPGGAGQTPLTTMEQLSQTNSFLPSWASRALNLTNCTGPRLHFSLKGQVAVMEPVSSPSFSPSLAHLQAVR